MSGDWRTPVLAPCRRSLLKQAPGPTPAPVAATALIAKEMMMTTAVVRLLTLGVAATAALTAADVTPAAAGAGNTPVPHAPSTVLQQGQARLQAALDREIAAQLERVPGGNRIAANKISYERGKVVLTFASPSASQVTAGPVSITRDGRRRLAARDCERR